MYEHLREALGYYKKRKVCFFLVLVLVLVFGFG